MNLEFDPKNPAVLKHPSCMTAIGCRMGGVLVWCLVCSFLLVGCTGGPSTNLDPESGRWKLDAWVTMSQDSTGSVRPTIVVSVPHMQLVFKRDKETYTAGLEVRVVAWRNRTQVGGGVATGRAILDHDTATRTRVPLEVSVPLLVRGEDPVSLEVTAQVMGTARIWKRHLGYTPQDLAAMPLWITELRTNLDTAPDGGLMMTADSDSVRLMAVLMRHRNGPGWPDGGIDLVSEVTGTPLTQPLRQHTPIQARADTMEEMIHVQAWHVDRLPFGRLRLQVLLEVQQAGQRWRLPREPALSLLNLRVPLHQDRDWRRHLSWLDGHLPVAVRDSMRVLDPAQRPLAWAEIWQRMAVAEGITSAMAERRHLMRIIAADDRFGGFGRGALSDRGRVFIRWGEPAKMDVYMSDRIPGAIYEIWIYPAAGMRFVFYDAHGMGDFRLRQTEPLAR